MQTYAEGDRVKIDIPDKDDPDYYRLHRQTGTVVDVFTDDTVDVRWRDLRPLQEE